MLDYKDMSGFFLAANSVLVGYSKFLLHEQYVF